MVKIITIFCCFLLSACTTLYNPSTDRREFIIIDTETEKSIGKVVSSKITEKYKVSSDLNLIGRVSKIGSRIVSVSDRKDIDYKFYVLEEKELNAFTLPGGFIYINKGLLDILEDDELAYILAHEVGHIAARHIAKRLQTNLAYQVILELAFAAMGKKVSKNTKTITDGIDTVYGLIELKYSRNDEYEADRLGVKYAYLAGFNPYASISALTKLKNQQDSNFRFLRYFRTHPYVDERIEALKLAIPQITKEK